MLAVLASSSAEAKRRPPPPPPPPPVVVIPVRPQPPMGAPNSIVVPPLGVDGKRVTTNAGLNPDQIVWNMRSALNVAALDCNQPQYTEIQAGYRAMLRTHAKRLATANRGVDTGFRARFGAGFVRHRETYLTRVYNFYAFPPVLPKFCDAALLVIRDVAPVSSLQLHNYAALSMPRLDKVYEDFYRDYAKYQIDAAAWDARYGQRSYYPPTSVPPQRQ